jgi:PAS domain S-box-containing protein
MAERDEDERLRSVALRNAQAILAARQRAEEELRKQSEWLRVALSSIGDAVISTDAEGRVTFMNGVAETLTGWLQAEALGRPLTDVFRIINEHTRQPVENPALRALRTGTIVGLANHTVLVARDGTERPIDDSAAPMRGEVAEPVGAVLVFRDVTERKRAEEARARLAAIVQSSDDAIVSKTLDGVITSWNAGAQRIFGYTANEAVGKPITLIIPPDRLDEEAMILERLRRGERVEHFETKRVAKDGRLLDISLTVSPVRDEAGGVIGASKIARDITRQKEADEALRRSERELADFFENASVGLHWVGPEGTILRVNKAELDLLGYTREEYVGRHIAHFHADQNVIADILRRLAAGETLRNYEARMVCKDGSVREVLIDSSVLREQGRFVHTRCFTRDVTDQKQAERRVAIQLTVARVLAEAKTIDEAAKGILQAVCERQSWDFGAFWHVDRDDQVLRCSAMWHRPSVSVMQFETLTCASTFRLGEGLPGRVWATAAAVWVPDLRKDNNFPRAPVAATEGLRTGFGCPIALGDEVLGVAEFFSREVRPADRDLLEMITSLGSQFGQFIERRRAEAAAQAANERAAGILESINEGFVVLDADWNFAYINSAFERMNGVRRAEILGRNHWDIYPATIGTHLEAEYRRVLATGQTAEFENYYKPWDRWFVVKAYPSQGGGLCVQVREVTEQRRAEAAIRASNEKLRLLADTIPQLAWMARSDGHIFWYNRRWYAYTGTTPEMMEGWGWQSVHDPQALPLVMERWKSSLATGEPFDMVFPLRGADGCFRPFLTRVNPLRNDAGEILYWFGTNTDISEQKRAEESSRFLAEASGVLAAVVDVESTLGKVAALSVPFFADWCIVDLVEADGSLRRLTAVHRDPDRVSLAAEISRRYPPRPDASRGAPRVRRTGEPELVEKIGDDLLQALAHDEEHLRALKELGLQSYLCVPLATQEGVIGILTFLTAESGRLYGKADLMLAIDLAHRGAVAAENARLYGELRAADRRKDEFIALLAHELRNPLAPIRNGLQVLRIAEGDVNALSQTRAMMERQLGHMVRLIDDLLDISRINQNKMELRRSRVALRDVINSAVETARPFIEEAGQELIITLPSEPVHLSADVTRLAQVFSNLLTNSAKYTGRGGRIWLTAQRRDGEAVVSVRDTGIGIPAEAMPRIFDMFSQVDRSIERSSGGLGIGLALVKGLVEMHDGIVTAASDGPGMGSTFTITLPALDEVAESFAVAASSVEKITGPRRRILVVDDNRDAAASMAMILKLRGDDVRTAHDGIEAVEVAERFRPQVILMDVGMPRLNGLDATRRIRQQPWGQAMTIIALTGWGQEGDRSQSRKAGCDGHLVKPVSLSDVEKLLEEIQMPDGK